MGGYSEIFSVRFVSKGNHSSVKKKTDDAVLLHWPQYLHLSSPQGYRIHLVLWGTDHLLGHWCFLSRSKKRGLYLNSASVVVLKEQILTQSHFKKDTLENWGELWSSMHSVWKTPVLGNTDFTWNTYFDLLEHPLVPLRETCQKPVEAEKMRVENWSWHLWALCVNFHVSLCRMKEAGIKLSCEKIQKTFFHF